MKTQTRFIKGIVTAAAMETPKMPWSRGSRRQAFIAKRNVMLQKQKSA